MQVNLIIEPEPQHPKPGMVYVATANHQENGVFEVIVVYDGKLAALPLLWLKNGIGNPGPAPAFVIPVAIIDTPELTILSV